MSADSQHLAQGALGLAINKQGQFLITLRNEPRHPQTHRKWQVTGGGINFGESPEQALIREVQEELSVTPKILFPYPIAKTWVWQLSNGNFHVLLLCYLIDIGIQVPKVDGKENLAFRWIKPDELSNLEYLPLTDDFIFEAQKLIVQHDLLSAL